MDEVSSVMEVVDMYPEATFVGNFILNLIVNLIYCSDAGSNIGVYSLGTFQLNHSKPRNLKKFSCCQSEETSHSSGHDGRQPRLRQREFETSKTNRSCGTHQQCNQVNHVFADCFYNLSTLSDTSGEILYAAKEDNNTNVNPGAKHLISEDEAENKKVSGESLSSVTLKDILMFGKMKTYILKVDIEGFDCKV